MATDMADVAAMRVGASTSAEDPKIGWVRDVSVNDLRAALTIARETYGPQSQAAFAIEAIIKACEG